MCMYVYNRFWCTAVEVRRKNLATRKVQTQGHVRVIVSFGTAIASCGYIFECALYISAFVMYFLPHSLFRAVTVL